MSLALDVTREIRAKKETTFGTLPTASAAQIIRRTSFSGGLTKRAYQSAEIRADYQIADMRHGGRGVAARLDGELAPGAHQMFVENILRRLYATAPTTGPLTTVTAAAGPPGTFTRASGSFITDGFRVGHVVRWTGWTGGAVANNARNYRIIALTATVMTVTGVGDEAVVALAAGPSVTCTVVGRHTFVPLTGHTNESIAVEDWNPGAPFSERLLGCRVNELTINIPPDGLATIGIGLIGQDSQSATTAYYTSPTAPSTTPITAGPTGAVRIGGTDYAVVTSAQLTVRAALGTQDVIGALLTPDIFPAPIEVEGQLTILLQDDAEWARFSAETEFELHLWAKASTALNADFLAFYMARCKYMGRDAAPANQSIVQTLPFRALLPQSAVAGVEQTSLMIQDSGAV